jgi:hypothetical protein
MTIQAKVDKWKKLDIKEQVMFTVVEYKDEFVQLNREQLMDGVNKNNVKITPEYKSERYAKYKNNRNPSAGYLTPDLYNKGSFHEGIVLNVLDKNKYSIKSIDSKNKILEDKYKDIFGLNSQSKDEIKDEFQVSLIKRIKDATS